MSSSAQPLTRRDLIAKTATVTAATLIAPSVLLAAPEAKEPEVTATEDLMREHGVLRRALLVYTETHSQDYGPTPAPLMPARSIAPAFLFRDFGENYHEKMLEEEHIFPGRAQRRRRGGKAHRHTAGATRSADARSPAICWLLPRAASIATANAEPLARSLEAFVLMYRNHAAREDTIVFPAWKTHFTNKQLDELSDQFEDIEHKMFGKDGFDDAVEKISAIETTLGLPT